MPQRLIKAFQNQFVEADIHPFMKVDGLRNIHLRNFNPTREEDVLTQPIGQKGYVFMSVKDTTRASVISYESVISVAGNIKVNFSISFIILPTGAKTGNNGDIKKDGVTIPQGN